MVPRVVLASLVLAACADPTDPPGDPPDTDTPTDTGGDDSPAPTDTDSGTTPTRDLSVTGIVTVVPFTVDGTGGVTEVDLGGGWPYGALWVSAFTADPQSGAPVFLAQAAVLDPTADPSPFTLELAGAGPIWIQAVLDLDADGVIGVGEPSAVRVLGADETDVALFVSAPAAGPPAPLVAPILLSGDATVDATVGPDCAVMLFSANGYGPYFVGYFPAPDVGRDIPWTLQALANQGEMHLSGACDANANGLVDPADAWGTATKDGTEVNPVMLLGGPLAGLHVDIPFAGAMTTAEPIVHVAGEVADAAGFDAYPAEAVVYVVAQRGTNVPDLAALDHEYGWQTFTAAEIQGDATFSLSVPAHKEAYVWSWVDLDGDGVLNEAGEPAGLSGPWYTDQSHEGLLVQVTPAL